MEAKQTPGSQNPDLIINDHSPCRLRWRCEFYKTHTQSPFALVDVNIVYSTSILGCVCLGLQYVTAQIFDILDMK